MAHANYAIRTTIMLVICVPGIRLINQTNKKVTSIMFIQFTVCALTKIMRQIQNFFQMYLKMRIFWEKTSPFWQKTLSFWEHFGEKNVFFSWVLSVCADAYICSMITSFTTVNIAFWHKYMRQHIGLLYQSNRQHNYTFQYYEFSITG